MKRIYYLPLMAALSLSAAHAQTIHMDSSDSNHIHVDKQGGLDSPTNLDLHNSHGNTIIYKVNPRPATSPAHRPHPAAPQPKSDLVKASADKDKGVEKASIYLSIAASLLTILDFLL
ncbi:hypothetical protein [Dinghuibacter silviterrae]|uniref:Uncharacterized protein n=1 Tax=Dinghuibacter silviterrae TaxID=1539049 RepID=A0A4R8DEW4_9BACT|nr:hypothetical protein [Dinghuibacter silviterrae]TDW96109.1 hypothetical protein EDB95_3932 [Dinghuibacter silviterrae]